MADDSGQLYDRTSDRYAVVRLPSVSQLVAAVQQMQVTGWRLAGGVAWDGSHYLQAVERE